MKVLHYTQEFSPATQTFIYDQIIGLKGRGFVIEVCTRLRTNETDRPFDKLNIVGNFNSIPPSKLRLTYNRYGTYLVTIGFGKWRKIINRFQPDIFHCHFGWALVDILPLFNICRIRKPLLVSLHGTDVTMYPNMVKDFRRLVNNYKGNIHFTCPSEYLKKEATKTIGISSDNITVLPNMFNLSFLNKKIKTYEQGAVFKIINIARFVKWKGHQYLVEAFSEFVKNKEKNARLTLIGDGGESNNIVRLIKKHGIEDKVNLVKYISHDELPELLVEHQVYVQPSILDLSTNQCESFGVSVIEAIASGLPVIVTGTGGLPDTISTETNNSAIVVEEKNAGEIYDALCHVYDCNAEQDIQYRKLITEKYHPDNYFMNLEEIYSSVISR